MTIITLFSPGPKTKEILQETLIRRRILPEENLEGPSAHSTKHRAGGEIKVAQRG